MGPAQDFVAQASGPLPSGAEGEVEGGVSVAQFQRSQGSAGEAPGGGTCGVLCDLAENVRSVLCGRAYSDCGKEEQAIAIRSEYQCRTRVGFGYFDPGRPTGVTQSNRGMGRKCIQE